MKKMWVLFVMLVMFLGGCVTPGMRSTVETNQFIAAGVNLSRTYDQIHSIIEDKFERFSVEDQTKLLAVDSNLKAMIQIAGDWAKLDNSTVSINRASVESVYNRTKDNYLIAKEIIHLDLFSSIDRLQLANFDNRAMLLDSKFMMMQANPTVVDNGEFILDALDMGITLGKILLPLIKDL